SHRSLHLPLPVPVPTVAPELSTLSLHDALPISSAFRSAFLRVATPSAVNEAPATKLAVAEKHILSGSFHAGLDRPCARFREALQDRKSTRLNSSHVKRSYAAFCLKKKTMPWWRT